MRSIAHTFIIVAALACFSVHETKADAMFIEEGDGVTCGFVKGKWTPGKLNKKNRFSPSNTKVKKLKRRLKKASGSNKSTLERKLRKLKKKVRKQNNRLCANLAAPATEGVVASLSHLPPTSSLISADTMQGLISSFSTTNTAPPLVDISETDIKDLFWNPGVIDALADGTAQAQQCGEFFGGGADGTSGGMGACHMTQSVGYSLSPIIEAGTTPCYLKNIPTRRNVQSGGVSLVSGRLPGGDVTKLFSPDTSQTRLVQVKIENEQIVDDKKPREERGNDREEGHGSVFIRVHSQADARQDGQQFKLDLWFCDGRNTTPTGYERIRVGLDNTYSAVVGHSQGDDEHSGIVTGSLALQDNGQFVFDNTRSRQALVNFRKVVDGVAFKADIEATANNQLLVKMHDTFGNQTRKAYTVSTITGDTLRNLTFTAGAYKDSNFIGNTELHSGMGGVEFRDGRYVSAPNGTEVSQLAAVDIVNDDFYTSSPTIDFDLQDYSCATQADIVVSMNFDNSTIQEIARNCEQDRIEGLDYCYSDTRVRQAEQNLSGQCTF